MNRIFSFLFILLVCFSTACAPSSGTSTSEGVRAGGKVRVNEDLSVYRPKYPAATDEAASAPRTEPANHVNNRVAVLMDTVASVNKGIKYAQGYRILAYNGSERETVMNLRKTIIGRVPEEQDYLTYQQPNFRLKIGDYFSRMEAQQVLNQLSDLIPNAQIVQEQINIPKK
ncbi:sporulation protein [Pontibacter sp. SGAir0037]|uniref:sporulation protein n=1 Tax=Pontibacter sp. SGAir0037 TaxID=2571030 RepID=UPI0010CCE744|nr:sporulation protein [Pontibacter sp. SGAir0037]QCR23418.1 sporulation protein [Pontibacter sp. SGAir0037]